MASFKFVIMILYGYLSLFFLFLLFIFLKSVITEKAHVFEEAPISNCLKKKYIYRKVISYQRGTRYNIM